jgi:arabinogalactan oligomer/maltooligosaccharide transport system permease protein
VADVITVPVGQPSSMEGGATPRPLIIDEGLPPGAQGRGWFARVAPYLYLSPALIAMTIFTFIPIAVTIGVAFTNWSLNNFQNPTFIGADNFVDLFAGPFTVVFLPALLWNIAFAALAALTAYAAGLGIALLLSNKHMWETNLYRGLLIVPMAIPGTLAFVAWQGLLQKSGGQVNNALEGIATLLGVESFERIPFLLDPTWAKASILLVSLWLGFPFFMNFCLAALSSIPTELYEAAELDGAGAMKRFRFVTMPLLVSFTLPLLLGSFAFNFTNFGASFLVTGGGPPRPDTQYAGQTDILISVAYKMLNAPLYRYGLASAMALVIFIVLSLMTISQIRGLGLVEKEPKA